MTLKDDAVFKEKLNGGLKNDIRNLDGIFMEFSWKQSKVFTLMGCFSQKHIKF